MEYQGERPVADCDLCSRNGSIKQASKQLRTFESKDLWLSGGDASQYQNPAFKAWQLLQNADVTKNYMIPVYIDKLNPGRYFIDLSGVEEKKENEHQS